jgi:hypothetical protein
MWGAIYAMVSDSSLAPLMTSRIEAVSIHHIPSAVGPVVESWKMYRSARPIHPAQGGDKVKMSTP